MHETKLRVRYAETDQMGVVYYANYYVWMEIGRAELVRSLGVDYHDLERTEGLLMSVIESECRYLSPARYDQQILVATTVLKANARLVEFEYAISDALTGRPLACGFTKHLWLNRDFRPTRLPEHYLRIIKASIVKK